MWAVRSHCHFPWYQLHNICSSLLTGADIKISSWECLRMIEEKLEGEKPAYKVPKNWCFWTVVLEKTLESPLDCKEIKPVNPKGNQPWILIGRTDAEAEASILWPQFVKNWLIGKDPDAGKDWRQEEMRATEDEMLGWHHQFNGHELGQTLGDGEG